MSALEKILATCGLNANHPQFMPPPVGLVSAMDTQRRVINEKRRQEGKTAFSTMYDLSGNIIDLEISNGYSASVGAAKTGPTAE